VGTGGAQWANVGGFIIAGLVFCTVLFLLYLIYTAVTFNSKYKGNNQKIQTEIEDIR